ncbi:MAG: radical SAM protein [Candidatus Colwellbacteria bacterium]|nr:radical SAM protein [Candidatus Colwellbacteria bacterium]
MEKIEEAIKAREKIIGKEGSGRFLGSAINLIYPDKPFSFSDIKSMWRGYLSNRKEGDQLGLYVHIPFCFSKCSFCSCYSRTCDSSDIKNYIDNLISHLDSLKDVFDGALFDNFYLGGGTPSIAEEGDLSRLLDAVFLDFKFIGDGRICSELDPFTSSLSKLKMFKDHGFTRVSLGVQSFDGDVLRLNGRGHQTEEMVYRAFSDAREVGFKYINLDLIVGLYGDTPGKLVESFRKALSTGTQKISLYAMQPIKSYLDERFDSDPVKFDRFWQDLLNGSLSEISDLAEKAGFSVPDYSEWYLKMTNCSSWSYQDLRVPRERKEYIMDGPKQFIIGVGENSSSKICGVARYNTTSFSADPEKSSYMGSDIGPRKEMIDYLVSSFSKKNQISLSEFQGMFNRDFLTEFDIGIGRLKELGVIRIDSDAVILLSGEKRERSVHVLMFFDDDDVIRAVKSAYHGDYLDESNSGPSEFDIPGVCGPERPSLESLDLDSPEKMTKWEGVEGEMVLVTSGRALDIIDGSIVGGDERLLSVLSRSGDGLKIKVAADCVLVREYVKEGKIIYEEKMSFDDVLKSERSFVFFVSDSVEREVILMKEMIDVA